LCSLRESKEAAFFEVFCSASSCGTTTRCPMSSCTNVGFRLTSSIWCVRHSVSQILVSESSLTRVELKRPCVRPTFGFWKSSLVCSAFAGCLRFWSWANMAGIFFVSVFLIMRPDGWCCFLVCHQIIWSALLCYCIKWLHTSISQLTAWTVFVSPPSLPLVELSMQWVRVRGSIGLCKQQCESVPYRFLHRSMCWSSCDVWPAHVFLGANLTPLAL
jgi:hypothetical protein